MSNNQTTRKKIVFLTQVFYPDQSSTSQLFTPLLENLSERGFDITVLAGRTVERSKSDQKSVKIVDCGFRVDHKKNLAHRFVAYTSYLLHCFYKLLHVEKDTIVIAVTNPPMNAQLLYFSSFFKKFKYGYFFLDIYPEGLEALGKLNNRLIIAVWRYLNLLAYKRAENLYCLGRDMIDLISKNYRIDPEDLVFLPHWSASENDSPIDFSDSKSALDLNLLDKFVVQYSGNMGIWHDMETFVRAADMLKDQDNIRFLFIGDGVQKSSAQELAAELNLSNIIWRDFVSFEELPDSLACCHLSLISLKEGLEGIAVPCKFYGILQSGRCVIALVPKQSEIALAIDDDDVGFHIKPGDVGELAKRIQFLQAERAQLDSKARNSRRAYEDKYNLESAVQTLYYSLKD